MTDRITSDAWATLDEAGREAYEAARLATLQEAYGPEGVFTTSQLRELFSVEGFGFGYCVARRKATGEIGSLQFDHLPRFYYGWVPHRPGPRNLMTGRRY